MLRLRISILTIAASVLVSACTPDTVPQSGTTSSDAPIATTDPITPSTAAPPQTVPLMTLPPGAAVCDAYTDVAESGALEDEDLREISGIVASRRHPRVLWAHNDSRGGALVYALSFTGRLVATWELDGASALDWEDISIGPGPQPDTSYLYVGDIGDNFALRSEISVFRFPEPDLSGDGEVKEYERFRLTYPEPGLNAEALAVDPVSGDLIVITKDRAGPEIVYSAPAAELRDGLTTRLEEVARLDLGARAEVTAADFSPAGERIALRGYRQVWIWPRVSADLATTFANDPCRAASPDEVQGEALGFSPDGLSIFTISEGTGAPVHRISVEP